eukprot:15366141-Ditylum_brightwellii.AAC.1
MSRPSGFKKTKEARVNQILKHLDMRLFPLHSHVLALLDYLEKKHHRYILDNLNIFYKFPKLHMTTQATWGLSKCVLQWERTTVTQKAAAGVTTKAAVLKGGPNGFNPVTVSIYAHKPVQCLSPSYEEIKWVIRVNYIPNIGYTFRHYLEFDNWSGEETKGLDRTTVVFAIGPGQRGK